MKFKSEIHNEKMKEVLESNATMEERRKQEYYHKQQEAELRKK